MLQLSEIQLPGSSSTSILSLPSMPYLAANFNAKSCWWNTDKDVITCNRHSSIYAKTGLKSVTQIHIL